MDNEQAKEIAKNEIKKQAVKKILASTVGKWVVIIGIALIFLVFLVLLIALIISGNKFIASNGVYDKYIEGKGICDLAMPLKKYTITSLYGYRVSSGSHFHEGIDLGGNYQGTDVYAAMDGVATVHKSSGYGNYVIITNSAGEKTKYLHLYKYSIKNGTQVKKGDKIGEVGNTGGSNGVHLDFRFFDTKGKSVSLNNLFGYTDIEECIVNKGSKSEEFRRGCMKNSSRKMTDLEKEQFKNACAGTTTIIEPEEEPETDDINQNADEPINETETPIEQTDNNNNNDDGSFGTFE